MEKTTLVAINFMQEFFLFDRFHGQKCQTQQCHLDDTVMSDCVHSTRKRRHTTVSYFLNNRV